MERSRALYRCLFASPQVVKTAALISCLVLTTACNGGGAASDSAIPQESQAPPLSNQPNAEFVAAISLGKDIQSNERDRVKLSVTSPMFTDYQWRQLSGPAVTFSTSSSATTEATMPDLDANADVRIEVSGKASDGQRYSGDIEIHLLAYPMLDAADMGTGLKNCARDEPINLTRDIGYIKDLYCVNFEVTDLHGISKLANLESLSLATDATVDGTELASLHKLRFLNLTRTQLTDWRVLTKLSSLYELRLEHQDLQKFDVWSDLSQVYALSVVGSQLKSLQPLINLSPANLSISRSQLGSIEDLGAFSNLISLRIDGATQADTTYIAKLTQLLDLHFENSDLADLAFVENLANLRLLYVEGSALEDLSALAKLPKLAQLAVTSPQALDLSPLASLSSLNYLRIDQGNVDLYQLLDLKSVTQLELINNHISDLSPLATMGQLESIYSYGNAIQNLNFLSGFQHLQKVGVQVSELNDISGLLGLSMLQSVNLDSSIIPCSQIQQLVALVGVEHIKTAATCLQ